jgi:hypothetical protein
MQNADGEKEEMRKVWCCKWAGWCPFNSMKQVKSFERRTGPRDVNGEFTSWSRAWFKDHFVDGLDRGDNWLSCMQRKDGHLRTYTMRPHDGKGDTSWRAPFEESLVDGWSTAILWAPWWEERMRSWRAPVYGVFVGWVEVCRDSCL